VQNLDTATFLRLFVSSCPFEQSIMMLYSSVGLTNVLAKRM
jgi:hypothetical protein